jgi:hypothetical protein
VSVSKPIGADVLEGRHRSGGIVVIFGFVMPAIFRTATIPAPVPTGALVEKSFHLAEIFLVLCHEFVELVEPEIDAIFHIAEIRIQLGFKVFRRSCL